MSFMIVLLLNAQSPLLFTMFSLQSFPSGLAMAGLPKLPFIVVKKANKASQRHRISSLSSNTSEDDYQSCQSSPSVSRDSSPVRREQGDSSTARREQCYSSSVRMEHGESSAGRRKQGDRSPVRRELGESSPGRRKQGDRSPVRREQDESSQSPGRRKQGDSSPLRREQGDTVRLKNVISSDGGFSYILNSGGEVKRQVYLFPTKVVTSKQRSDCVREFIGKLYEFNGEDKNAKVDNVLCKLTPECTRQHIAESSQAKMISKNVRRLPDAGGFKKPNPDLAPSTPGPRVSQVKDIYTPHTPRDSLRIMTHLQLSEDDGRYVRSISLVGLASEYSIKQLKTELLGNSGKGWVKAEKLTFKKWFRTRPNEIKNSENGKAAVKEIIIGKIPKEDIIPAVKHWADTLSRSDQYVDMQDMPDCPDILRDTVVIVCGNDSGQGHTREGIRFCNRTSANSGSKVFVTAVMVGTDKSLSLFQKQFLFSSLSALRNLTTIKMGGKERKVIKFSCMDYEAAAEDIGTQVCTLLHVS